MSFDEGLIYQLLVSFISHIQRLEATAEMLRRVSLEGGENTDLVNILLD